MKNLIFIIVIIVMLLLVPTKLFTNTSFAYAQSLISCIATLQRTIVITGSLLITSIIINILLWRLISNLNKKIDKIKNIFLYIEDVVVDHRISHIDIKKILQQIEEFKRFDL